MSRDLLHKLTNKQILKLLLQEKPTNCGTKDADVPDNIVAFKSNADPLKITR